MPLHPAAVAISGSGCSRMDTSGFVAYYTRAAMSSRIGKFCVLAGRHLDISNIIF
jgi:hypothetical protein